MKKRRNVRSESDSQTLKENGFEFRAPVDEYSYQPDSGSVTGGILGEQEYGISGGISDEESRAGVDAKEASAVNRQEAGVSEYSEKITHPLDEPGEVKRASSSYSVSAVRLKRLIVERLSSRNDLSIARLVANVSDDGAVTLEGETFTNIQKSRAEEVVRSIPGVQAVVNGLLVRNQEADGGAAPVE